MRFGLSVLFLYTTIALGAQTNEGTDFWLAFMQHRDVGQNKMVVMITSKYNTSGEVELPLLNWSQGFSVTANQVTVVHLPSSAETLGSESISSTGIHILAQLPVSVYMHQYHSMRSEASVVLPLNSLGREYYAITYQGSTQQNRVYPAEFIVVGAEESTEISIQLADATGGGRNKGDQLNITLNPGQTYQVQAAAGNGDLTGSRIRGNKPFAVFAGNSWTEVPSGCSARDNLLEQMYPVSTWGRQFVTVPNAQTDFDVFRILATGDNTTVSIQGTGSETHQLSAGQFIEYRKSEPTYIVADKPVAVMQYNVGSGCSGNSVGDPSMVFLNSIEQIRDTVTLFSSSFEAITENYINVIALAADTPFITIDGRPLASLGGVIGTVGANSQYAFARLNVSVGPHTLISSGCGIIATAYGYGNVESYAYSGGASFKPINANPISEGGCLNDTVFFDTGLNLPRFSLFWDFGNGDTSSATKLSRIYSSLGVYPATLIATDHCLNKRDTIHQDIRITLRQAVEVSPDVIICEGESIMLSATDLAGARYAWTGPNGFFSTAQFPELPQSKPEDSGYYEAIGIISGCATNPARMQVRVVALPKPELGPDQLICPDFDHFELQLSPGQFAVYRWQDGSTQPAFDVQEAGHYAVQVWDEFGCTATDSVALTERCPTKIYAPNAFSPNGDGINDTFRIYGEDILSIELRIYDRWGGLLVHSTSLDAGWDGTFRGKPLDSGVFLWRAEVEGYRSNGTVYREILSGEVTLIK